MRLMEFVRFEAVCELVNRTRKRAYLEVEQLFKSSKTVSPHRTVLLTPIVSYSAGSLIADFSAVSSASAAFTFTSTATPTPS